MLIGVARQAVALQTEIGILLLVAILTLYAKMFSGQGIPGGIVVKTCDVPADHLVVDTAMITVAIDTVALDLCVRPCPSAIRSASVS